MKAPVWLLAMGMVAAALAGAALLGPASWSASENPPLEQMIESAETKADHEAIAARYEQEAEELKAKAEQHRKSLTVYEKSAGYATVKGAMVQHCSAFIRKYDEAAEEVLALANLHRKLAAEAEQ